jgi:thymidylate synthase
MYQYDFLDARHALYGMVQELLEPKADVVAPRGQKTRELRNVTMTVRRPETCLATGMGRGLNTKLAAAETLQLLMGSADAEWMTKASPKYLEFTGGAMTGAYGPRLRNQMPFIIQTLRDDKDSRQAVATIWDAERDLVEIHGDRPCTVYVSFMIRRGGLVTSTYMRSQDVYLGLPYDLVMFSQLHQTVANVLDVEADTHVHTVQSLHLYERDEAKAANITMPPAWPTDTLYGLEGETWYEVQELAESIAYDADFADETFTEGWLRKNSEDARS